MSDLISRAKLFNKLAYIKAPPEANEYKAAVYSLIQGMESASEESCDTCKHNSESWDSEACDGCTRADSRYEQELISREDAREAIEDLMDIHFDSQVVLAKARDAIVSLPSAVCDDCIWHVCNYNKVDWDGEDGYISRKDAVSEIHKYFVEQIDNTPWAKDEDGDEVYTDMPTVNSLLACNKELSKRIKALPSADRPTGRWVNRKGRSVAECDQCGRIGRRYMNYCSYCGARMLGEDGEV